MAIDLYDVQLSIGRAVIDRKNIVENQTDAKAPFRIPTFHRKHFISSLVPERFTLLFIYWLKSISADAQIIKIIIAV